MVIAITISLVGAAWYLQQHRSQPARQTDAARFQAEYPRVAVDNRFVYARDVAVLDMLEHGTGVVFLGYPQCPWCQRLSEYVDQTARAEGVAAIHYLNIRQARASKNETYQKLVARLAPYLSKDENGQPRIFVPDVTIVKRGSIVWRYKEEPTGDSTITPDRYWTAERAQRAVTQLRRAMRTMKH
jgi:rhodanese domain protein